MYGFVYQSGFNKWNIESNFLLTINELCNSIIAKSIPNACIHSCINTFFHSSLRYIYIKLFSVQANVYALLIFAWLTSLSNVLIFFLNGVSIIYISKCVEQFICENVLMKLIIRMICLISILDTFLCVLKWIYIWRLFTKKCIILLM